MINLFYIRPEKIEEDLKNLNLRFKSNYSAEFLNIPPMLDRYWSLLQKRAEATWQANYDGRIVPLQEEFLDSYMEEHDFSSYSPNKVEGIKTRVLKTYPSLTRELHFISNINLVAAQNDFPCTLQMSNSGLDLSKGVDLAIQLNGVSFSLRITKTDSNTDWEEIKADRKSDIDVPNEITIVAHSGNTFPIGQGEKLYLIEREVAKNALEQCLAISKEAEVA